MPGYLIGGEINGKKGNESLPSFLRKAVPAARESSGGQARGNGGKLYRAWLINQTITAPMREACACLILYYGEHFLRTNGNHPMLPPVFIMTC